MRVVQFTDLGWTHTVRFAYDPQLVALIKGVAPASMRSYDPTLKQWTVNVTYVHELADSMRELGHTVVGLDPPLRPGRDSWAQQQLDQAGMACAHAVYWALVQVLRLDTGSTVDARLTQQLDAAFDRLPAPRRGPHRGPEPADRQPTKENTR
jgi:hypothetical protein